MGDQQRVPLFVELEWTAGAIETHLAQGVSDLAAVLAASLFNCQQRQGDRIVGLSVISVSNLAIGLLNLADELLRGRNVGGGRAAIVKSYRRHR